MNFWGSWKLGKSNQVSLIFGSGTHFLLGNVSVQPSYVFPPAGTLQAATADNVNIVAFGSSDNFYMTIGGTPGFTEYYFQNMTLDTYVFASPNSSGDYSGGMNLNPSVSGDGTILVFESDVDLLPADTNGAYDVYVYDSNTLTLSLVSQNTAGVGGNAISGMGTISSDGKFVVFRSASTNLDPADSNSNYDLFLRDLTLNTTKLVSSDSAGVVASAGVGITARGTISGDGTYVAFQSPSTNLVASDTNGLTDIFVKNTVTGAIVRVSTTSAGAQSIGGNSLIPRISLDGTVVGFSSTATNLVAGDTNAVSDVFLKNISTGAIQRVSVSSSGAQLSVASQNSVVSPDNQKVIFATASAAVASDTNGVMDVYIRDVSAGTTVPVSTKADGTFSAVGMSTVGFFMNGGTEVAFFSLARDLVPGDSNATTDYFVKNLSTGAVTPVGALLIPLNGQPDGIPTEVEFSPDDRSVVFGSRATNLILGDNNGVDDVFIRNLNSGVITRVSTDSSGVEGNGASFSVHMSATGTEVGFSSQATNLVAGDTNSSNDVFIKSLTTGVTTRVSTTTAGVQGNGNSTFDGFASDSSFILFESFASNLVAGDTNGGGDVFIKNLGTGVTTRVSTTSAGAQSNGASGAAILTSDDRYVFFQSSSTDLVAGDTNAKNDLFRKDLILGTTTRVSTTTAGAEADGESLQVTASADGNLIAYYTDSTNLAAADTNGAYDVYVKNLTTGVVTLVSADSGGTVGNGQSYDPQISADGTLVVFASDSTNLVPGDTNSRPDVFVKTIATGAIKRLSVDDFGVESNGYSGSSALNKANNSVVYISDASNLAPGDVNHIGDIFIRIGL